MERATQVHIEHRVEVLVAHLFQRAATDVARVVDQDVDAAVVLERGLDDRLAALAGRDRLGTRDGFLLRPRLIAPTTCSAGPASTPWPARLPPESLTTTFAPRDASSSAYARPSPRPAPVTTATRSSNLSCCRGFPLKFPKPGLPDLPCRATL